MKLRFNVTLAASRFNPDPKLGLKLVPNLTPTFLETSGLSAKLSSYLGMGISELF